MPRSSLVVLLAAFAATCGGERSSTPPGESDSQAASETETTTTTTESGDESGDESSSADATTGDGDGEPGDGDGEPGDGDGEPLTVELVALAYGDDPAQSLDLYLPQPRAPGPTPVVILAHGGLWQGGDKSSLAGLCEAIVLGSAGTIACASINYRLSAALGGDCQGIGVDTYVDQLGDFVAAYERLTAEARTHNLEPTRVHVGGHSAGAHLAHSLNLRWTEFAGACDGCTAPAGAIGFEGIYDIAAWDAYDQAFWSGQFACATRRAFGAPPDSPDACVDELYQRPCWDIGSPTYLADHHQELGLTASGDALLVHSPDDDWVDGAEASNLGAALTAAFAQLDTIVALDGACGDGSHDGILSDPALATCIVNFVTSNGATI